MRIAELATRMPADETQLLYSLCIHGRAELGLAPDEYVGLTMVLLRLLPFKAGPAASATAEKKTLKAAEPVASAPAVAPRAEVPAAEPGAAAPLPADEAPPPAQALAPARPPVQALPVRAPGRPAPESRPAAAPGDAAVATPVRHATDLPEPPARPIGIEPAPPAVVPGAEGDFWHAVVQKLVAAEAVTALTRELALQAELVARTAECWTLRVESGSLAQSGARERLQAALAEAGHAVQLQVELGAVKDCPARRNALAATQRQKAAEAVLMADPFVQEMMREFGAKIVPGSVKPL